MLADFLWRGPVYTFMVVHGVLGPSAVFRFLCLLGTVFGAIGPAG